MNKGFFHSLIAGIAIGAAALAFAPGAAEAHPAAPKCSTAKLIVPWKAGGGTHVIFSIFEKIIKKLDVKSKNIIDISLRIFHSFRVHPIQIIHRFYWIILSTAFLIG